METDVDIELELALIALQSRGLRERLMQSAGGSLRYAPFALRVSKFFGITRSSAEDALEQIASDPTIWRAMPIKGMQMASVDATVAGQAMFLRAEAGMSCPTHIHHGEERLIILEGRLIEDSGMMSGPGDLVIKRSGTRHAFRVPKSGPCVSAYRIERGIQFS